MELFVTRHLAGPKMLPIINEIDYTWAKKLPGVRIRDLGEGDVEVVIPEEASMRIVYHEREEQIRLYRLPSGEVIGHSVFTGGPDSLWESSEAMWLAATPYEFAVAEYDFLKSRGQLRPDQRRPLPEHFVAVEE